MDILDLMNVLFHSRFLQVHNLSLPLGEIPNAKCSSRNLPYVEEHSHIQIYQLCQWLIHPVIAHYVGINEINEQSIQNQEFLMGHAELRMAP